MSYLSPVFHRWCCHVHVLQRAAERGIPLEIDDVDRIEQAIERLKPAFERPGHRRYQLTVKRGQERIRLVYDTTLGCMVTVLPPRAPHFVPQAGDPQ